MYIFKYIS